MGLWTVDREVCGMAYGGNGNFMCESGQQCSPVWPLTSKVDAGWVCSFLQFLSLGQALVKTPKVLFCGENLLRKVNTCKKYAACRSRLQLLASLPEVPFAHAAANPNLLKSWVNSSVSTELLLVRHPWCHTKIGL